MTFLFATMTESVFANKIIAPATKQAKGKGFSLEIPVDWVAKSASDGAIAFTKANNLYVGKVELLGYTKGQSDSSLLPNYGTASNVKTVKELALPAIQATVTYKPDPAKKTQVSDLHYILKDEAHKIAYDLVFRSSAVAESSALNVAKSFKLSNPVSFSLKSGQKEMVTRSKEGITEKVEVIPYTLNPSGISFKLDTVFNAPSVDTGNKKVTFTKPIGAKSSLIISLQVLDGTKLDQVMTALNSEFTKAGYKKTGKVDLNEKGSLPATLVNFSSKTSYAGYTLYPLDKGFLVIKHVYPLDAGDGAGSMLNSLRASLKL
ncbi:hypothetical protein D7Z26_12085 [Cohnella endophytica]|uniref:Uncharacterized protein n=2 Tax=Cohnella endophytica TaxID=2419778 RepID=A0A494XU66_9BACL|nr:hypothetical protein D7Z26_12085 [Cohnella endophytica]